MKKTICVSLLALSSLACAAPAPLSVTPVPAKVELSGGVFTFGSDIRLGVAVPEAKPVAELAKEWFRRGTAVNVTVADKIAPDTAIAFVRGNVAGGDEAYVLSVTPKQITITAQAQSGWLYGFQTLRQMLPAELEIATTKPRRDPLTVPVCAITDAPRFGWRGMMLDEARHFFGKAKVLQILDIMALHKLNIFHWHLSDSEGWRIEIKKYPKLTEIGSRGDNTLIKKDLRTPKGEPKFYTQDEIREVVAYAAARGITIVPEIDMPGHADAMNRSYPEYSGGGIGRLPLFTLNPGKEETYTYIKDILTEVAELFPGPWIHYGGDEVNFANKQWIDIPEVKELMKRENLKDLLAVEHYFNRRAAAIIRDLGKTVVGWDEIASAGVPTEGTLVYWWRHDKPQVMRDALAKGFDMVFCPRRPLYFDFVQHDSHKHGRRWGGFNPIDQVYAFGDLNALKIPEAQQNQVKGIHACIWAETVATTTRLDFMIFPRLSALAEIGWTKPENKSFDDFKRRLGGLLFRYRALGAQPFNPLNPESTPEVAPTQSIPLEYIDNPED